MTYEEIKNFYVDGFGNHNYVIAVFGFLDRLKINNEQRMWLLVESDPGIINGTGMVDYKKTIQEIKSIIRDNKIDIIIDEFKFVYENLKEEVGFYDSGESKFLVFVKEICNLLDISSLSYLERSKYLHRIKYEPFYGSNMESLISEIKEIIRDNKIDKLI